MVPNRWRILVALGACLLAMMPQDGFTQAKKKNKSKSGAAKAKAKANADAKSRADSPANTPTSPPAGSPAGSPASPPMNRPTGSGSPAVSPAGPGAGSPAGSPAGTPAGTRRPVATDPVDATQLLSALSAPYRLNDNLVPVNRDIGIFVRASQAPASAVRDVARRATFTIYLNHLLQLRKPPEDVATIAREFPSDEGVKKLAEFVQNRKLTTEEENQLKGLRAFSDLLNPSKDSGQAIFDRLFKDTQERESLLMPVRLASQRESMKLLAEVRQIADARRGAERKDAIRAALDRSSRQLVELRFTNESGATLHDVFVTTRMTPDLNLVGKVSDAQIITRLGLPALSGKSDLNYSAQAADSIRMGHELAGMERGTMVFIPELPAGAQVVLPLATTDQFALVRSTELSLWSNELRIAALALGNVAAPLAQRLVPDRGGNVTMSVNITRDSPVDAYDYKLGNGKFCQVFELPLEQRVTYEVRSVIPPGMDGRVGFHPCHLRIENAAGEVVALEKSGIVTNDGNSLTFTPPTSGMYRLICTAFHGESRSELSVRKKSANTAPISPVGKTPPLSFPPNSFPPNSFPPNAFPPNRPAPKKSEQRPPVKRPFAPEKSPARP